MMKKQGIKKIRNILKNKKWIIEGSYSNPWVKPIIDDAEIVVILNIKPSTAKRRAFVRYLKRKFSQYKKPEKIKDIIELFKFINTENFNRIIENIKKLNRKRKIIVLNSKKEIREFLKNIK